MGTLRKHAEGEHWTDVRKRARQKAGEKAAQRTADAAAANAVKLEKARALLIDKIIKALEQMPEKSGTRIRHSQSDRETGKQTSVDYDLQVLVNAFEKLSSGSTADFERQKQFSKENNTVMMTYADLFKRAAKVRTIADIEDGGGDVQD